MESKEYILCAANHYDDGTRHVYAPINITSGFVTCGLRHCNCIGTFAQIVGFPYDDKAIELLRTETQGFLTNLNRFVNRREALDIAILSNQVSGELNYTIGLFSEDLY